MKTPPEPFQGTFRTAWGGGGLITIGAGPRAALTWDPADCRGCGLHPRTVEAPLPWCQGYGPATAEVALVGQNPSTRALPGVKGCFLVPYLAVRDTLKLQGSTRAFRDLARAARLDLGACYATNAVKCATPDNRAPTPAEVGVCVRTHLKSELRRLPYLRKVVAFGAVAGAALGVGEFHRPGYAPDGWFGHLVEVVVIRHPNWTLRQHAALGATAARLREFLGGYALRPEAVAAAGWRTLGGTR